MMILIASLVSTQLFAANLPYVRTESGAAAVGDRRRVLDKVWIMAERQMYWPGPNFLHKWNDRPLFYDPDLRTAKDGIGAIGRGYLRDIKILQSVGLDGFGGIAYYGVNLEALKLLEKHPPVREGLKMMPVICPSDGGINLSEGVRTAPGFQAVYNREKKYFLDYCKSPYAAKVNGKYVFWTYGRNEKTFNMWAKTMREDPDIPPFIMMGEAPFLDIYTEATSVVGGKEVSPATLEKERAKILEAIKLMGGMQVFVKDYVNPWNSEYPLKTVPTPTWRKYLLPMLREILSRPENQGVLVGTYLEQAYVNNFEGWTKGNFGTAALRTNLDEVLAINPDILMGFEWNEENENTHFQPTVAHGEVWARILNYYRSLLDREPPKPMRGDDPERPNLVLSVRQALKIGEPYHLELLYLPDGTTEKTVTAQVTLRDESGKELITFPKEIIPTGQLKAIDYRIASEKLAASVFITPELRVTYRGTTKFYQGFDSTRLSPTVCRDYLYTHQPLQELLVPVENHLAAADLNDGRARELTADLVADEPLASLEILDGLQEVAAADPNDWFDNARYAIFRVGLSTVKPELFGTGDRERERRGIVTLENAPHGELRNSGYMWETASVQRRDEGDWALHTRMFESTSRFFLRVPREELAGAKLRLALRDLPPITTDLEAVEKLGKYVHSAEKTVTLTVARIDDLADLPLPLGTTSASIKRVVKSANRYPIYQLRAVTKSGKVFRSAPLLARRPARTLAPINVWSDTELKSVQAQVRRDLIPDINYRFEPTYGALLKSSWGGDTDARLGGGSDYGYPMGVEAPFHKLPASLTGKTAPEWIREDDRWLLSFKGGTYLCLPHEVITRGSEYAVEFELRPRSAKDQVILRSSSSHTPDNGLQLLLKNGTLHLSYYGIAWYTPPDFDTRSPLKPNEWNRVRIVKRLECLECEVNGVSSKFNYDRRARAFSCHVFGSNLAVNNTVKAGFSPFEGELKSLRISHNPDQDK